ncbi:AbfB domain-containing protein [Actinoplanes sp. L3-i22]|uniref:AbfB domain-containing protein n=1 Tax=Actinoplanes sp. L3-i22 TaxID=2836373 RepID=UPI001C76745D|nr:AbfB domain-containing protein [Actinoplanes sp. L3-i22]BCY12155.1 hypothetical protein L3i22_072430 [Actinoplanes sp. L3-i22]
MTIYGSGGTGTQAGRRLHPGVLALVIASGLIVAAAVGYLVLRSPAAPVPQAAASPSVRPTTASAAPAPTAPDGLATGSWQVSPADDKSTFLAVKGEFATLTDVESPPVTVVKGLADEDCFTFRDEDGKYLRHFDYRLRFAAKEDSDLFRQDATFCAEDDQPAGSFRVRSKNYPDYFLHRRGADLYIDKPSGDSFEADSTFTLQPLA